MYGSLSGNFHVCCHAEFSADTSYPLGNSQQSLDEIWNGQGYKSIRKAFLNNKIPSECKIACYDKEDLGSISNRQQVNKRFSQKSHLQQLTNEDGSVDNKPSYLDIRFGNLCNFRCRMCGPYASTSWYRDAHESSYNNVIDYYTDNDKLWDNLPHFIPYLEDVYFAGGEPFIQDGHYKLLDMLIASGYCKNINLQYNTNLSYKKYKKHDLKNLWSMFKSVSLWPSVEGFGAKVEYSRKELKWEDFEENAIYFKKYITTISSVINIYSITSMPNLILWCKKHKFNYFGTTLIEPPFLSVTCIPHESKEKIIKMYKKFCTDYKEILTGHDLEQIKSWLMFMKNKDDSHLLTDFKREQTRLDLLRNESFESVFPEFATWYKNI
jgi:organic radical activating enzyme